MEKEIRPFDWQRIFFGDEPPFFIAEIAFRTVFLYVFALMMLRLMGKRGMGRLSALELVVIIALGSAVGDPMFQADVPLIHGMAVITTLIVVEFLVGLLKSRSPQAEAILEKQSQLMVEDGVITIENLRRERLASDEIYLMLREKGYSNLGQVGIAYWESSGELSIFRSDKETHNFGLPLVPPPDELHGDLLHDITLPAACLECGYVAEVLVDSGRCPKCRHRRWISAEPVVRQQEHSSPTSEDQLS